MRYTTALRLAWVGLVGVGALLTVGLPGHLVAVAGSAVASLGAFVLYPRQPWWGEEPGGPSEPAPSISVPRSVAAYALLYVMLALAIGIGWLVLDLVRFDI